MKVGLSCIITPREWSFEETLKQAKAAGYEAIELVIRDGWDISLDTPKDKLREMAEAAADMGIELSSVCPQVRKAPKDIMTNDEAIWRESQQTIIRCMEVANGLGIDTMLLTLGALTPDLYYNEAYANSLKALQLLAPTAEKLNVKLAIEYVWNKFLLSPMEFARFCADVGSPYVGFFFDTGNMVIFGYPEHWIRICGPYLMKVHFKDFKRKGYQWTPLLEGDVDFAAVMRELDRIGYDDVLLSEVDPGTAPLESTAEAIRKIMTMR